MRTSDSVPSTDYALFEYYRSAKVIAFLERAGVPVRGRVLDAGCGGGGMPLSLAEEADEVVGIDPAERFQEAGVRLGRERGNAESALRARRRHGAAVSRGSFDLVLSHAVIEHVADAPLLSAGMRARARAWRPRVSVDVAVSVVCRRASAATESAGSAASPHRPARGVRHVPAAGATRAVVTEGAGERELVHQGRTARRDQGRRPARKSPCRQASQSRSREAGLRIVREELHVTSTVRRLPAPIARWVRDSTLMQDALISNMEYVLAGR